MEHGLFPKLAPTPIQRQLIENWMAFHRDMPLRYIYGPTGSGKTTAALLHARTARHPVVFVQVPPAGTTAALLVAFDRALDCPISSVEELLRAFPAGERFEIIVADIDNADEAARAFLTHLPGDVPPNVTLTYLARSRRVVDMVGLTTKGIAATLERSLLAFSQAEAAELCESLGVAYTPSDINQLVYSSEGWAFAVAGSIRDAASEGRDLRGALTRWQERNRRLIQELLSRSVAGLSPAEAEAARRLYAGESPGNLPAYSRLHDLGLLLSFSDLELRPIRAVAPAAFNRDAIVETLAPSVHVSTATIEMFGQFEMVIDGQPVEWCRRRDRQIVEYLALQLDSSATRHNLIATFWPNTDVQLASQSLRTACSTIRRAIAQRVGYDRVHYYFSAGRALRLNTDHISISSLRFSGHIREAENALNEGDELAARAHYLAASRIYRGPLLDSEGREPWFRVEFEWFGAAAAVAAERALEIRSRARVRSMPAPGPVQLLFLPS
jgi:hypothetical protein